MTPNRPTAIDLVVDTSAILALSLDEPPALAVRAALEAADGPVICAATLVELHIVTTARLGPAGASAARTILDAANVVTMPLDTVLAELAMAAWDRFGRGNHPARLNYGDCFSYALAHHVEAALLCVGSDFPQTDIEIIDLTEPPGGPPEVSAGG